MITGQPPYFFAGIWNCTYIWPIVIWCGASGWLGGVGAAWYVTFCTPPMKKLP